MTDQTSPRIVLLIPCLNEEYAIGKVIHDFRQALPEAEIIVFDNHSTDRTRQAASEAGADGVYFENRRGKGFVVQTMFRNIDADIYLMVDGDDTYPAERVRALLQPVLDDEADMTIGSRIAGANSQFQRINWLGNAFFLGLINTLFHARLTDILSGYRAMNRKLVKSLPLFERGFGIEAEMTIKALERGFRLQEVPVDLRKRMEGSYSKIRIVRDGLRILVTIFTLFRDYKPLTFFGGLGLTFLICGSALSVWAVELFMETVNSSHLLLALLGGMGVISGILIGAVGLVLHTINRRFQEMEHFTSLHSGIDWPFKKTE